jgi:6-phosphogluconolactonase
MIKGFIGTYTEGPLGRAKGIYSFSLNGESGAVEALVLAAACQNPSYLTLSPSKKQLYAVNEGTPGHVSAYALADGQLRLLNSRPSEGASPCHIVVDKAASHALLANYASGNVAVFPLGTDGTLGEPQQIVPFSGNGPNAARQEASHAHFFMFDGSGAYGFACDLGADRVMAYRFDRDAPQPLSPLPYYCGRAGSGPRHGVFHPQGDAAYVVCELDSTIDTLAYDGKGGFTCRQSVSTVPTGVTAADSWTAAIKLSPDARHLYASNRGHDSIAVYRVNDDRTLALVDRVPSEGKTPRDFAIDPSGTFLLACHQDSDNLVVFRIDRDTGLFRKVGAYPLPSGVCVVFC